MVFNPKKELFLFIWVPFFTDKASRQKNFNFKILNFFLLRFAPRGEHLRAAKIGRFNFKCQLPNVNFREI